MHEPNIKNKDCISTVFIYNVYLTGLTAFLD